MPPSHALLSISRLPYGSIIDVSEQVVRHLSSMINVSEQKVRHMSSIIDVSEQIVRHLSSIINVSEQIVRHMSSIINVSEKIVRHLSPLPFPSYSITNQNVSSFMVNNCQQDLLENENLHTHLNTLIRERIILQPDTDPH